MAQLDLTEMVSADRFLRSLKNSGKVWFYSDADNNMACASVTTQTIADTYTGYIIRYFTKKRVYTSHFLSASDVLDYMGRRKLFNMMAGVKTA